MSDVPLTPGPQRAEAGDVGFRDFAMRKHRSLWGDAWQRLISSTTGRVGLAIVVILVLGAVLSHFFWVARTQNDALVVRRDRRCVGGVNCGSLHSGDTVKVAASSA